MTDIIKTIYAWIWLLLPLLLIVAALSMLLTSSGRHARYRRKALRIYRKFNREHFTAGRMIVYLRKINPYVFEELVLTAFARKGFRVTRNRRYSGDGGIDGRLTVDGKRVLVQCKRYLSHICAEHVADFARICEREGCTGVFVHTGRTGRKSREVAAQWRTVTFISGDTLADLMTEGRAVTVRTRPALRPEDFDPRKITNPNDKRYEDFM